MSRELARLDGAEFERNELREHRENSDPIEELVRPGSA